MGHEQPDGTQPVPTGDIPDRTDNLPGNVSAIRPFVTIEHRESMFSGINAAGASPCHIANLVDEDQSEALRESGASGQQVQAHSHRRCAAAVT